MLIETKNSSGNTIETLSIAQFVIRAYCRETDYSTFYIDQRNID